MVLALVTIGLFAFTLMFVVVADINDIDRAPLQGERLYQQVVIYHSMSTRECIGPLGAFCSSGQIIPTADTHGSIYRNAGLFDGTDIQSFTDGNGLVVTVISDTFAASFGEYNWASDAHSIAPFSVGRWDAATTDLTVNSGANVAYSIISPIGGYELTDGQLLLAQRF